MGNIPSQANIDDYITQMMVINAYLNENAPEGKQIIITEPEGLSENPSDWEEPFTNSTQGVESTYFDNPPWFGVLEIWLYRNLLTNYWLIASQDKEQGISWTDLINSYPALITNIPGNSNVLTVKQWFAVHRTDDKYKTEVDGQMLSPEADLFQPFLDFLDGLFNTSPEYPKSRAFQWLDEAVRVENYRLSYSEEATLLHELFSDGGNDVPTDNNIIEDTIWRWNNNTAGANALIIDMAKVLHKSLPFLHLSGLQPSGIAPDYDLHLDPSQNVSEDIPRLPDWDYSADGWTRPSDTAPATSFFTTYKDFSFDEVGLTLTYYAPSEAKYKTLYFTNANYKTAMANYRTANTPTPPTQPNGTSGNPWINAGGITTSASYNYQYVWANGVAQISVAPLLDTTGWARPIPAPTQVAPPNNFYNSASATSLQAKTSTYSRHTIDFAVQLPNNNAEIDINIVPGTAGLSFRVGNCAGLNSGNAIYFVADKRIPSSAVKFYGNNGYILPTFKPNGEFFFTCVHITSSADQFVVIIDEPNIDWISIFRSPGVVGV